MALPLPKGVTSLHGSAWCRNKCRPSIGRSSVASASAGTAICACCSCRVLALFCSDRKTGKSTASERGSRPPQNDCITMLVPIVFGAVWGQVNLFTSNVKRFIFEDAPPHYLLGLRMGFDAEIFTARREDLMT